MNLILVLNENLKVCSLLSKNISLPRMSLVLFRESTSHILNGDFSESNVGLSLKIVIIKQISKSQLNRFKFWSHSKVELNFGILACES